MKRNSVDDQAAVLAPRLWEGDAGSVSPGTGESRQGLRCVPTGLEAERQARPEQSGAADPGAKRRSEMVLLVSVDEAARALGIGRSKTYELIAEGALETVHIGRAARVPVDAIATFVARLRRHRTEAGEAASRRAPNS